MRLRTFNAPDLQDAMKMIRDSMGDSAIIISTIKGPGGKGISVTAAAEEEDNDAEIPNISGESWESSYVPPYADKANPNVISIAPDKHYSNKRDREMVLKEVEKTLRFHNTPDYLVTKLLETSRYIEFKDSPLHNELYTALTAIIETSFTFSPLPFDQQGSKLMLVGAPGCGKTMTIAKMAAHIVMDRNKATVITTDNRRAGGIEQLSAFTAILGAELKVARNRKELVAALKECDADQRVLIDSASANPYELDELKELAEFTGINEIEPVLVMAAGIDSGEAEETARAFSFLGIRRLLVTRSDTVRRFGSLLAAANAADLSFSNISSSARAVGEFRKLGPALLTNFLLQHKI